MPQAAARELGPEAVEKRGGASPAVGEAQLWRARVRGRQLVRTTWARGATEPERPIDGIGVFTTAARWLPAERAARRAARAAASGSALVAPTVGAIRAWSRLQRYDGISGAERFSQPSRDRPGAAPSGRRAFCGGTKATQAGRTASLLWQGGKDYCEGHG